VPADTSTVDGLLKDVYERGVKTQLVNEVPLLSEFEREDNVSWQGREHVVGVHVNRNRGVYFTAEGGRPPTAGRQQVEQLRIPRRHTHGQIQLTAQLIKAARSETGAFATGMRFEMDNLINDLRIQRLFAMWGDGRGIRALVNTDPGTGTLLTLDAPGGVAGATNGSRFLNIGDHIVFVNAATGTLRAGGTREIITVPPAGTTVTVGAAIDTVVGDNDFVVKAYGPDASVTIEDTDWQHPPMGMLGMIDNGTFVGTYFGLSRTAFPILQSTRIASVGALSADIIQRAIDVALQVGNCKISSHWMDTSVRRAYLTLMEMDRRYTGEYLMKPDAGTVSAKGAYKDGLHFGGVPINTDPFAPYGTWFGFDNRSAYRYVVTDGEWADEDGAVLSRVATQVDTFEATYRIYDNFCVLRPNQSFRLDAITANVVVSHIV
jgi:hypothetical protein